MKIETKLDILVINCSQRDDSKSLEVSKYIQKNVLKAISNLSSSILDLSLHPFLLDHYGYGRENDNVLMDKDKKEVLDRLYACDAAIFVVPEWGGMIPPALVNLLLLCAYGSAQGLPLGHKPGFIVGVSASGGGTYPISLLKGYAAKNSHLTWTPLHTIISNVEDFLKNDWSPKDNHRFSQVQSRLVTGIESLIIYANKLKEVRSELVSLSKIHPFGQ